MFNGKRFLTRGVEEKIPVMIQIFIWECIDKLDIEKDYLRRRRYQL